MILRLDYLRTFYARHQDNFGQPADTDPDEVRAMAYREIDGCIRQIRAETWNEARKAFYLALSKGPNKHGHTEMPTNPYERNEETWPSPVN